MPNGTVRWFDVDRGFGFLAPDDEGEDLFVHVTEVLDHDVPVPLREGQTVEYEVGEGPRGPQARQVRVTGDSAADATFGVLGTVSWYEPTKGYGFVAPDGGGPEIFVHSSGIVTGGIITEGQRVAYLVGEGEKGPQAEHLLPLGPDAERATQADGADGTVAWFDPDKGFGFIAADAGGDVFVHVRALTGGLTGLDEGDRVAFDVVEVERGPQAREVRLMRGSGPASATRGGSARPGGGAPERRDRPGRPASSGVPVRGGEGVVARFDADRGFGFISPDAGGADLFVHVSVVRGGEPLEEGDRVRYQVRQSDRGPQAHRVELI
ncbi:cold-shock protein [Cellulomonas marina]|uniref:Cold shock protein (Beta-ribbon, CspA family) n=1 Tax=Cellulomonas marina TaxID=988821 RepID=A0A1I0Y5T8_9CELL|nr:cold shock domain-containing protein [Cellulomonas marina]GIG29813.1 cold-shock protein CspA [Cellulomonas marina]SFB08659.1 cold shock protein (beta-ribbon, CspA family) [Cellulomonas marina]